MTAPISLSPAAVDYVEDLLSKEENAGALRVSIKESGCNGLAYVLDLVNAKRDNDLELAISDNLTVYLDPDAVPYIEGTEIDIEIKTLGQKQVIFNNPRQKGSCGCGESFNV